MNTEGVIDEENMTVSPLLKEWFDKIHLIPLDEIHLIPADAAAAPDPAPAHILLTLSSCLLCRSKQRSQQKAEEGSAAAIIK
jgi:hypothetical protein